MKRLFLIFSHRLTDAQKEDAKSSLGIEEFIYLPDNLQRLWSNIPPDIEDLDSYLSPIFDYLKTNAQRGDYALIQGDFGATCKMVAFVKNLNLIAVYATTKRNAIERKVDGKVIKTAIFEHVRFRRF